MHLKISPWASGPRSYCKFNSAPENLVHFELRKRHQLRGYAGRPRSLKTACNRAGCLILLPVTCSSRFSPPRPLLAVVKRPTEACRCQLSIRIGRGEKPGRSLVLCDTPRRGRTAQICAFVGCAYIVRRIVLYAHPPTRAPSSPPFVHSSGVPRNTPIGSFRTGTWWIASDAPPRLC